MCGKKRTVSRSTSTAQLRAFAHLAKDVGVMSEPESETLVRQMIEVRKMLHGLPNKLTSRKENTPPHSTSAPV